MSDRVKSEYYEREEVALKQEVIYQPSLVVKIGVPFLFLLVLGLNINCLFTPAEEFIRGGLWIKILLSVLINFLNLFIAWAYIKAGLIKIILKEEVLEYRSLLGSLKIRYSEIVSLKYKWYKAISLESKSGKVIFFSVDEFPHWESLVLEILERCPNELDSFPQVTNNTFPVDCSD